MKTLLTLLITVCSMSVHGASVSLVGQLDPSDPQDVTQHAFTLSARSNVVIQSWGFGGTSSAPGGTNAQGSVIPPGGFDPYVSIFAGSGPTATFVASNDDGVCPPGTSSGGNCFDSRLALVLPAGNYTLALSAFQNMSFAENYGSGNLGDGFVGLGNFGSRNSIFAVDIVVAQDTAVAQIPTLDHLNLFALMLAIGLIATFVIWKQPKKLHR